MPRVAQPAPNVPHPLPEPLAEQIAGRFRLLADPMRLRLLDALRDGPDTIGALATRLGTSQQNASKHLGLLAAAGLVARRSRGNSTICSIADPSVFTMCETVCDGIRRSANAVLAPFQTDSETT